MQSWLEGRIWVGKGAQVTGMTASLRIVKQSWFKHLWELHKEWTEAGVSASRVTTLRRLQEKGYQATSEPETTSEASYLGCGEKELSGPKSSFQMKVNFAFHLETRSQSLEEEWRVTDSLLLEVQCEVSTVMIWAAMSSAGVGPLCFLKSTVNAAIYQEILEHFMLPSADKLYGDADFIFQQDLAPAHTAKGTKSWFNDHGVTVLDWPANSPDLNPIENLWGIVKRKMRDTRPNNADELKATVKETWACIPPQQCHKLITSMPRRIEAVIKAKGAPTKYWVHIQ